MDQHVQRAVTTGLRSRGMNVLTAYEDAASELEDPALLDRATELERVLFTQDDDFLVEAAKRLEESTEFTGIVYGHQQRVTIGLCIEQLELIANVLEYSELKNQVIYLPL